MPTANYDSSNQTKRVQARALYLYNLNLQQARAANPNITRSEQPQFDVLSVVTLRKQGGCDCVDSFQRRNVGGICLGCN